jgi:hypothetical protein
MREPAAEIIDREAGPNILALFHCDRLGRQAPRSCFISKLHKALVKGESTRSNFRLQCSTGTVRSEEAIMGKINWNRWSSGDSSPG